MFIDRSKFHKQVLKRSSKVLFWEIISKSDGGFTEVYFLWISSCTYSASGPHSPELCLLTDENFAKNFWKRSLKEHLYEIISKSDLQFQKKVFFKNFLMSVKWSSPHSPEECLLQIKISRPLLKRVTQGTTQWNYFKIWQTVSKMKHFFNYFLTHYRRQNFRLVQI